MGVAGISTRLSLNQCLSVSESCLSVHLRATKWAPGVKQVV